SELAVAFQRLYAELRENFRLTTDDLPLSPQERMKPRRPERSRGSPLQDANLTPRDSSTSLRFARNDLLRWASAKTVDALLCGSINLLHRRHRLNGRSRAEMERYLTKSEQFSPQQYYAVPQASTH